MPGFHAPSPFVCHIRKTFLGSGSTASGQCTGSSCIKNEYDNVYSVNFDGTIGWRVQSRKYLSREYENKKLTSYVGMYVRKETNLLQLNDWWGGRYIFDLNDGHIVGRDESGRDW